MPQIKHDRDGALCRLTVVWPAPKRVRDQALPSPVRLARVLLIAQILLYWEYINICDPRGRQPTSPECWKWDIQEAMLAIGKADLVILAAIAADDGSAVQEGKRIVVRKTDSRARKAAAYTVAREIERYSRKQERVNAPSLS